MDYGNTSSSYPMCHKQDICKIIIIKHAFILKEKRK